MITTTTLSPQPQGQSIVPGTLSDPAYRAAIAAVTEFNRQRIAHGASPLHPSKANPAVPAKGFDRFYALGQLCAENNWDPSEYVRTVYDNCSFKAAEDVCGKDLISEKGQAAYTRHRALARPSRYEDIWYQSESMLKRMRESPLYRGVHPVEVLANLSLYQFPMWFRLLYPWPPETRLCEMFDADVLSELTENPVLKAAMLKLCPGQLTALYERTGINTTTTTTKEGLQT